MAKVLVSYFSEYGDSTYIGIRDELLKNGNDVFLVNWKHLIKDSSEWQETHIKNEHIGIIEDIIKFAPDLVFNFCFCCPTEIIDKLSCPICVIDADNPNCFWNKKHFIKFMDAPNCYFWALESSTKKKIENFTGKKIPKNRLMFAPMATSLHKKVLPYKRNILFLGSVWLRFAEFPSKEKYDFIKFCYENYNKNFSGDKSKLVQQYKKLKHSEYNATPEEMEFLFWHFAGLNRLKYLDVLSDLGLGVYGNVWTRTTAVFNMDVSLCGHDGLVSDVKEVENLYNSSKISVNFSNPQANTGVSWRVFDIMASNSCLMVEEKPDWMEYFAPHLKQETLDAIVYKDRFDLREKAKKLLNDEKLRQRCVKDLNNAIEKNGRWIHRLRDLEKFFDIKLTNNNKKNPKNITVLEIKTIKTEEPKIVIPKKHDIKYALARLKIKKRLKLIFYLVLLIFAQMPIIDLLIRSKKRNKLLYKIQKWWR